MPQRLLLLITFLLLLKVQAYSQSHLLVWKEGEKLQFNDFSSSTGHNYLDVGLRYSYSFSLRAKVKFAPIIQIEAVFNKKTSTLFAQNSENLLYAQIRFDIQGYTSRLIKKRVNEMGEISGSQEELKAQMENLLSEISLETALLEKKLDEDLQSGDTKLTLAKWQKTVNDLIHETPDFVIENYVQKWSIGAYVGVGRHFFNGKTQTYFTDATSLNYGFEVDVKKSRIVVDMSLGINKSRAYLENNGIWESGTRTNLAALEFTYGQKFAKQRWLLVPYLGLGINSFTPRKADDDDDREITGYSPVAGVEMNYIFRTKDDDSEKVHFFVKGKLSVNPNNFVKSIYGPQINFRIAVGFDASLKRKRLVSSTKSGTFL